MKSAAFVLTALSLTLSGCTFSMDWLRQVRAQRLIGQQDFASALPLLQKIVEHQPQSERGLFAARQGARVAHLDAKNYPSALNFYKHLILESPDPIERKNAQRSIAQIYFENLQDFDQAVIEYEKLLKLENAPDEAFRYRLNLAKSHLQLNNSEQALNELNYLLEKSPGNEQIFDIKMIKANVQASNRQLTEAATTWENIMKEFPERATKEKVGLNLAVCYEELKNFDKAIEVLEGMRASYPEPDFLDKRIERLKERASNQPGAQGWKR